MGSALEVRALRYLARRDYSRVELERKLSAHVRLTPEILLDLLDKLEREGLLSTERAAEQIIRVRRSRFGSKRIIYELKEKGIDEAFIHQALPCLKETELGAALAIWQKKFGKIPGTPEERGKHMRFMMNRGFSMEVIQQVLSQASEEDQ